MPDPQSPGASPINTYYQLRLAVEAGIIPQEKAVAVAVDGGAWSFRNPLEPEPTRIWSPFFEVEPGSKTEPNPGSKQFPAGRVSTIKGRGEAEAEGLKAAMEWASRQFGVAKWRRNRMNDYVPAEVEEALPLQRVQRARTRR